MGTKRGQGRPKTDLGLGTRNVAWHDAMLHLTELSNQALDRQYAKFWDDGTERDDGGAKDAFSNIRRFAYDPASSHEKDRVKQIIGAPNQNPAKIRAKHRPVLEAVALDPVYSYINDEVYHTKFWRLIRLPMITDSELRDIISNQLVHHNLYRLDDIDKRIGRVFLKDKTAFDHATTQQYLDILREITSWHTFDSLTLLGALSREAITHGYFKHIDALRFEFKMSLIHVAFRYGLKKDIEILIGWLAFYRIFMNRWDEIPDDNTRRQALAYIKHSKKPNSQSRFWMDALAVRFHNTSVLFKSPIVRYSPDLIWFEDNYARLVATWNEWDQGMDVMDLSCPLFDNI